MKLEDFASVVDVRSEEDLETVLRKTYENDANAFWMSHNSSKYPVLSVLVRGELACLHYFPKDRHPGFRSVGEVAQLKRSGTSTFFTRRAEKQEVLNDSIVPFSAALTVAKEFFHGDDLPKSIRWFEL
jgi:hypothetical protein